MTTKTASVFLLLSCVSWFYSLPVTAVKCHQIPMNKVCTRGHLYHRGFLSLYPTLPITSVKCHFDKRNLLWLNSVSTFCFALCFLYELCIQAVIMYFPKQSLGNIPWWPISSVSNNSSPPRRNSTPVDQGLLIEDSLSNSDTSHSVGLLWTSDQPDAETSTWPHTTLTTDRHPCPRRDSNR